MDSSHRIASSRIVSLFAEAPLSTRWFIWLRWSLTPYRRIASVLPHRGRVLDLGSGHGLLSLALALTAAAREIIGVDHDPQRVQLAQRAIARYKSSSTTVFEARDLQSSLAAFPDGSLAGIAMIDILHYFDAATQKALLDDAARALKPGGILAVREVDSEGGLAAAFNKLYEKVSTIVGFTRSLRRQLHFRSASGWAAAIEAAGFSARSEPCGSRIFSDVLFVGCRAA